MLWALTDNKGTVRDLVDSSGTIQDHISYTAFGVPNPAMPGSEAAAFLFGYTGCYYDSATGLQWNQNRV